MMNESDSYKNAYVFLMHIDIIGIIDNIQWGWLICNFNIIYKEIFKITKLLLKLFCMS